MEEGQNSYDLVVDLLNRASLTSTANDKVLLLKQVQELIVYKEPAILDNFFDEMLGFQSDKSLEVRKFVITFLEHACKVDGDILSKIIGNLNILLYDDNVNIKKKVILSMSSLYKTSIKWLTTAKIVTEVMEETWKYLNQMRDHIIGLLDDDNDGIRTHCVKFCEVMVLCLTPTTPETDTKGGEDQSLDIVTAEGFLDHKKLEEDGNKMFKQLTDFLASPSITSVNVMACMTSLTHVAKKRPQFMLKCVEGFEMLHLNLPPTLANSQVSSVRKSLKVQMLSLLKHPAAADIIPQIATLLTDLGATQSEVNKAMPRASELAASKRKRAEIEAERAKKAKKEAAFKMPELPSLPDLDDEDGGDTPFVGLMKAKEKPVEKPFNPIDVTMEDIIPKLDNENVADLVLLSMVMLPDEMPPHFQSTYTPIAAAGTPGQIKHISRLLAVQLTNSGLGRGIEEQRIREAKQREKELQQEAEAPPIPASNKISVLSDQPAHTSQVEKAQFMVPLAGSSRKGKAFSLEAITQPLNIPNATNLMTLALQRILESEGAMNKAGMLTAFNKIASGLCTQLGAIGREVLIRYVMADVKNRAELALCWIYQEYVAYQGFTVALDQKRSTANYDESLTRLLVETMERKDTPGAASLFTRLILEVPRLPANAMVILKRYCCEEKHMYIGMNTMSELLLKRPCMQTECLFALLDFTQNDSPEVRNTAIKVIKLLYDHSQMKMFVDNFCEDNLNHLLAPHPKASMFPGWQKANSEDLSTWKDGTVRLCLYMYLSLTPEQPQLMFRLAETYVKAISDVKRAILRLMEGPIKQLGMESADLLDFIRTSPKGSETLITRIIHILTDRQSPTPELVNIVRDLYHERVADVRFIIPVLSGLNKTEIYAALPKLIKLTPVVVKEVFNRLLGIGGHDGQGAALTPAELMVALHKIDPTTCELKAIIKATTMCFQEKGLFTQEVLAVVMQQLMDVTPIPTLFMRTVIQSHSMYPKLLGFILNILQRLIVKQVWKQSRVWEGFVKCCQRCKPQSFQVLLQLPAAQIKSALDIAPDLRDPLTHHVDSFTAHQKAHIPKAILAVFEKPEPIAPAPPPQPIQSVTTSSQVNTEIDGRATPTVDEAMETHEEPGTPTRDEVEQPGTPIRDEPMIDLTTPTKDEPEPPGTPIHDEPVEAVEAQVITTTEPENQVQSEHATSTPSDNENLEEPTRLIEGAELQTPSTPTNDEPRSKDNTGQGVETVDLTSDEIGSEKFDKSTELNPTTSAEQLLVQSDAGTVSDQATVDTPNTKELDDEVVEELDGSSAQDRVDVPAETTQTTEVVQSVDDNMAGQMRAESTGNPAAAELSEEEDKETEAGPSQEIASAAEPEKAPESETETEPQPTESQQQSPPQPADIPTESSTSPPKTPTRRTTRKRAAASTPTPTAPVRKSTRRKT